MKAIRQYFNVVDVEYFANEIWILVFRFLPQAQEDEERDKLDLLRLALARNLSRTIL